MTRGSGGWWCVEVLTLTLTRRGGFEGVKEIVVYGVAVCGGGSSGGGSGGWWCVE